MYGILYTREEECFIFGEKIKKLREKHSMTQAELARQLNITRSSVNAWEIGVSIPSTPMLVELSKLFHVSTDYLLGLEQTSTLDISNLNEKEIQIIYDLIQYFQSV